MVGYGRAVSDVSLCAFSMLHPTHMIKPGIVGIPGDPGLAGSISNNNKNKNK